MSSRNDAAMASTETTTTTAETAKTCTDCGSALGRSVFACWNANDYLCMNTEKPCQARLCSACINKRPLYVVPKGKPYEMENSEVKKFCKSCFEEKSLVDFSATYDTIKGSTGVVFVFAHGGAGCRALFRPHAQELRERFGHGSILLDLPGHASLIETPLSLASCVETVASVLKAVPKEAEEKFIYVGGSLGAYAGIHVLGELKEMFRGAILIDCGQNVGPGASFKAKMGLVLLSWLGRNLTNSALMSMLGGEIKKSEADYKMLESSFGAGMFFEQAPQQVECLRGVAPAEILPKLDFPILFMNGSKDYRDSEDKWLEACANKKSELKVYDGGDHFFTHFSCFLDDILTRFDLFSSAVA